MYQLNRHAAAKHRRRLLWRAAGAVLLILGVSVAIWLHGRLKPKVVITQSSPVTSQVSYTPKNKQYDEPDFTISLPASWHGVPRPPGPYQSYTWQSGDTVTADGQVLVVYEDAIPFNLAVNRILIVAGNNDQVTVNGGVSDNCSTFTKNAAPPGQAGAPAKWQGVNFLCDQGDTGRDLVGTSSADGVNTVTLKSPHNGTNHNFFFTYTDYSTNPDYTVFTDTLDSLRLN